MPDHQDNDPSNAAHLLVPDVKSPPSDRGAEDSNVDSGSSKTVSSEGSASSKTVSSEGNHPAQRPKPYPRPKPALPKRLHASSTSLGGGFEEEYEAVSEATKRRVLNLSLHPSTPPEPAPSVAVQSVQQSANPVQTEQHLTQEELAKENDEEGQADDEQNGQDAQDALDVQDADRRADEGDGTEQVGDTDSEDGHEDDPYMQDGSHQAGDIEDESSVTGSDYSEDQRSQAQKRKGYLHRNAGPDTEEEDLEDDRTLEHEVVPEPGLSGGQNSNRSRVAKGKQRELDRPPSPCNANSEDSPRLVLHEEDTENDKPASKLKPGRWPQAALQECTTLGEYVHSEMLRIAETYNKTIVQVRAKAGLGLVQTQAPNPANIYRTSQSLKYPDYKGMNGRDWNAYINAEYKAKFEGLDEGDARRDIIYEEIMEEYEELLEAGKVPPEHVHQSASTRMKAAKKQFTNLAQTYHNSADVHVFGGIIYTGLNPAGAAMSAIFAGSNEVEELAIRHDLQLRQWLDDFTTMIKSLRLEKKGLMPLTMLSGGAEPSANTSKQAKGGTTGSKERDALRQELSRTLLGLLKLIPGEGGTDIFPWIRLLDHMVRNKFRLTGWPPGVAPPGPKFDHKTVKMDQLKTMIKTVKFERWTYEEREFADGSPDQARVPLVIDSAGEVLRSAIDSKYYVSKLAKLAPHRNRTGLDLTDTEHNNSVPETHDRPRPRSRSHSPVPPRSTHSTLPANYHSTAQGGHERERGRGRPRSRSPLGDIASQLSRAVQRATKDEKRPRYLSDSREPDPSRKRSRQEDHNPIASRRSLSCSHSRSRSRSRNRRFGLSEHDREVIFVGDDSDDSNSRIGRKPMKPSSKAVASSLGEDPEVRAARENLEKARLAALQRQKQTLREKERELREELDKIQRLRRDDYY